MIIELRFGQLPMIEIDGETIYQSLAINRFLARKYGLAGRNAIEEANVDMIVDCINDAFQGSKYCSRCNIAVSFITRVHKVTLDIEPIHYSEFVMALQEGFVRKDEVRQKVLIGELISTELPFFLGLIQQVLKDNGGKYIVGSEVCFVIMCAYIVHIVNINF